MLITFFGHEELQMKLHQQNVHFYLSSLPYMLKQEGRGNLVEK